MIPQSLIESVPPLHALNLHPSLLPKYRGAAPIQWAIANGDTFTGVTVQELGIGKFDRGRVLGQASYDMPPFPTFNELQAQLAIEGSRLTAQVLEDFQASKMGARAQTGQATRAPKISQEHVHIDWNTHTPSQIMRFHRAFGHQHPLWTTVKGRLVHLIEMEADVQDALPLNPGEATITRRGLLIGCKPDASGSSVLLVKQLRLPQMTSNKVMSAMDWWNAVFKISYRSKQIVTIGD